MHHLWKWERLPLLALPLLIEGERLINTAPIATLACFGAAMACVSRLMR